MHVGAKAAAQLRARNGHALAVGKILIAASVSDRLIYDGEGLYGQRNSKADDEGFQHESHL